MAKHYGCEFLETSAKQRIRIDETFHGIVREIRRLNEEKDKKYNPYNDLEKEDLAGCCVSNRDGGVGCIIL